MKLGYTQGVDCGSDQSCLLALFQHLGIAPCPKGMYTSRHGVVQAAYFILERKGRGVRQGGRDVGTSLPFAVFSKWPKAPGM